MFCNYDAAFNHCNDKYNVKLYQIFFFIVANYEKKSNREKNSLPERNYIQV